MADYRIDDLARTVGTTVRNIRAYQDRGLLAPPRLLGRVGIYSDVHVARLKHIKSLLQRGYASAQIHELFGAWEQGKDLGAVIGLEAAVSDPWSEERPVERPSSELRELLNSGEEDYFDRIVALGWIEPAGEVSKVTSPKLLGAFEEAVAYGFSKGELVKLYEALDPEMEEIARNMVGTAARHIIDTYGATWVPDKEESAELAAMLVRLRQLTVTTVQASLGKAMEHQMKSAVSAHLKRVKTSGA